jgi:hypothetical protein
MVASTAAAPRLYFILDGQRFGPLPLDHMHQKVASATFLFKAEPGAKPCTGFADASGATGTVIHRT